MARIQRLLMFPRVDVGWGQCRSAPACCPSTARRRGTGCTTAPLPLPCAAFWRRYVVAGVRVGIDFGTSNSAAALPGPKPGAPAKVVRVDPEGEDARLFRSVLYFPEDSRDVLAGGEAIARYL